MAYIIDTTLRDGEQAPGVAFSIDEKIKIASMLNILGVDEVEAGTPAMGLEEQQAIKEIVKSGFDFKISSWCRANKKDIYAAAGLGTECINISLPTSEVQMNALGKSKAWVLSEMKEVLGMASGLFSHVTMGAQDTTRTDRDFLKEFIFYATENGAKRIRISDTVGVASPYAIMELIRDVKTVFPQVELEFHGHNDLGMATANAITALQSGAECISATINGLGERAGNAVLEEVIAWADLNTQRTFNTEMLSYVSKYVAERSNQTLLHNKPVTGEGAYKHESGIHTAALLKDIKTYQFLNPRDYGLTTESFVFGKHSGRSAVKHFFESRGLQISDENLVLLLEYSKRRAQDTKANVSGEMLLDMYYRLPRYAY